MVRPPAPECARARKGHVGRSCESTTSSSVLWAARDRRGHTIAGWEATGRNVSDWRPDSRGRPRPPGAPDAIRYAQLSLSSIRRRRRAQKIITTARNNTYSGLGKIGLPGRVDKRGGRARPEVNRRRQDADPIPMRTRRFISPARVNPFVAGRPGAERPSKYRRAPIRVRLRRGPNRPNDSRGDRRARQWRSTGVRDCTKTIA